VAHLLDQLEQEKQVCKWLCIIIYFLVVFSRLVVCLLLVLWLVYFY
jgi:hypothetical protein